MRITTDCRVNTRLDAKTWERLRILAVRRRVTMQELTEQWIRDGLAAAERKEDVQ